jgi:hypothetical protein
MTMDERRPLNANACNLEQMRLVIRDIDANQAALFEEAKRQRTDFDALVAQLGHLGARPT